MIVGKYKAIYMPSHPRRLENNCVYEHIVIAEQKLGRPIKDGEVVHHKDENKMNNSPDNLIVFKSRSDHVRFHKLHCNEEYLVLTEDNSYICKSKENEGVKKDGIKYNRKDCCPICGNIKERHAKICKECFDKIPRSKCKPTKEKLLQIIIDNNGNFSKIGRLLGVSDNAIRKWCKSYNLPSHSYDYKLS